MRDDYEQLAKASKQELFNKVERELALGKECLDNIAKHQRGKVEGFIATDEFGVPYSQYVSETPYVESEALAKGRQLGKYPDPIRLIDVNSKRELHIPAEAFPEGLNNPKVEVSLREDKPANWDTSSTVGFIRVNGVEYPIISADRIGIIEDEALLQGMNEEWLEEGSYRELTLDAFSQLRPGYKGGNTPNLFKRCNPCSKVNPKDVAKRRAKNKVARKTKRK